MVVQRRSNRSSPGPYFLRKNAEYLLPAGPRKWYHRTARPSFPYPRPAPSVRMTHQGLDHLAICVPSTAEALKVWRDRLGFPVVASEVVNGGAVRLTHLDLGNTHLQLVEPLVPEHPLRTWLAQHGPGLHHVCLRVADVGVAHAELIDSGFAPPSPPPHQGIGGKRALFLARDATQNVQVEITGA